MNGYDFDWDATKAGSNLVKHGVSFEASQSVFDDMFAYERLHFDNASGEIRYVITGGVNGAVLTLSIRSAAIAFVSSQREGDEI